MRKRTNQIIIRLDDGEKERLKNRVENSALSQGAYLRHLINGLVPSDIPPPDYYAMMNELRDINTTLKRISQNAHASSADEYTETIAALNKAIVNITNAVLLPRRLERKIE